MSRSKSSFGNVRKIGKLWYAKYFHQGRSHTPGHSFRAKAAAQAWLSSEWRLIELDEWTPPAHRAQQAEYGNVTVGEWLEQFHAALAARVRASTLQNYTRVARLRILDADGKAGKLKGIPLAALTSADVHAWWDAVCAAFPGAETTNQAAYKRLRAACAEAVERGLIPTNPVNVRAARRRPATKVKKMPDDAELRAIYDEMGDRCKLVTALCLFHGVRVGEALALKRRHVVVKGGKVVIKIRGNVQRITKDGHVEMVLQPPKSSAGRRDVPILAEFAPLVIDHLKRFTGPKSDDWVTPTSNGGVMFDTSYRSIFIRARARAGVRDDITPHHGRNWLITRLLEQGATVKEVGALLGQDDVATILGVYARVSDGRPAALMEGVGKALTG